MGVSEPDRRKSERGDRSKCGGNLVSRIFTSWNQLKQWFRQLEALKTAA
jgi:hypothetical protein